MQKLPYILIVENDQNITSTLTHALRSDYEISAAVSGKSAIYKNDSENFDLVILDLSLPDISGLHVCQQLRERGVNIPILVLSGDSQPLTKIKLLDAGANDFICKPFSLGELKARMRVLLRSTSNPIVIPKQLLFADLEMDRKSRSVVRKGIPIILRRKEFALLECLMENAGSVVTRQILTDKAWEDSAAVWTNTVDVHIKHLRDKVDRPFETPLIKTVHGIGYRLESKQPSSSIELGM